MWWCSRSKGAELRTVADEMRRLGDFPSRLPAQMVLRKRIHPVDAVFGLGAPGASTSLEVSSVHAVLESGLDDLGGALHLVSPPSHLDALSRTLRSARPTIGGVPHWNASALLLYFVWPVKVKPLIQSAGTTVAESPWAGSAISRRSFEIATILEKASRID